MSNRIFHRLTPEILLRAYAAGIFPMAESADARDLRWFDPPIRALIPLDENFHVPKRLKRTILQRPYEIRLNTAFGDVIHACAEETKGRPTTWINKTIIDLYSALHKQGHAHSVEAWQDGKLVGGLYGVSLGAAFFGESMFSTQRDTSKIVLVYLVALLRHFEFSVLDTQFQTEHLVQFGTFEVTRVNYHHLLGTALDKKLLRLTEPNDPDWDHLVSVSF